MNIQSQNTSTESQKCYLSVVKAFQPSKLRKNHRPTEADGKTPAGCRTATCLQKSETASDLTPDLQISS